MLRSIVLALMIVAPATAFANQCPKLMQEIDAALQTTTVSDADKTKAQELRAQGEQQHAAGDHAASEASLMEAKKLLGI